MARSVLLVALLTLSSVVPARGQSVLRGVVEDEASGASLPSAHVLVEGTFQGTITNLDGEFELSVDALPVTLVVRYIGYASRRIAVATPPSAPLTIRLAPVAYEMPEVVVTDDDPAARIMRCVIERKQAWRADLLSYEADAYTRFTVSNDTGIVSIMESLSDVYWDRERGMRETVRSQRSTSNLDLDEMLPAAAFVANLYDDNIDLVGYNFVGVTHPRALDAYRFTLEGTRMIDDQLVYDIQATPRNKLKTAFEGELAVLADQCALIEVALTPGEAFLFPPPIETIDITFFQQFSRFGGSAWLPADLRSDITVEIAFGFLMRFPAFRIRQVSRLTDYEVNIAVPDTLFDSESYVTVDSASVRADTLLEQAGLAVPLDTLERMAYRSIDSTMTIEKAFAPTGALARVARMNAGNDEESRSRRRTGPLRHVDLAPRLRFNRVEGFHGGLQAAITPGPIRLEVGAGWSSELSDAWSYQGEVSVFLDGARRVFVAAAYADGPTSRFSSDLYPPAFSSAHRLLGGSDYFDYYDRERLAATAGYRRSRMELRVTAEHEQALPLAATTAYDLLADDGPLRPNPAVNQGDQVAVVARLRLGQLDGSFGFTGRRLLDLRLEQGALNERPIGASERFTRLSGSADWRVQTFFRRRVLPNALDVHLTAGTTWGDAPIQRMGIVDAGLGLFKPFGALRTLSGRPYEGDRHVGLFWEHTFRTVPFEILGLDALSRRAIGLIVTGGHARTWLAGSPYIDTPELYRVSDGIHHELGAAVSGIFGLLRVDVATRIDAPGVTVGVSSARVF